MFGVDDIIGAGLKILDKVIPDPTIKAQAKKDLLELQQKGELAFLDAEVKLATAQIDLNKEEAKSESLFKSGWRPAAGWICVIALGWHYLLQPVILFILILTNTTLELPTFDMTTLMTILLGMLGIGGYRSFEKYKGVQ